MVLMSAFPPLSPPQTEVLARGLLSSGFSCVLQMPTGSGKTWLAEQAMAEVVRQGKRAIYLTPLRALADELAGRWQERFAPARVGIFTGDYGSAGKAFPVSFADARLLVMTPERLDVCTRAWRTHWHWFPEVDLVVVDEFHLLGDRGRGGRLEGTLSRLQRLNPFARLLCLSATLGNRAELADWIDATEYASRWRPVPLRWRIVHYRKATDKPQLLRQELTGNVQSGGKSLVFVQSRRRAEQLAQQLQQEGLAALHHHAGLGCEERRSVEERFRTGALDVLVTTATLEMGLNLPVRQVVLYDLQAFDGSEFQPLSTNSVWQRAGRAGRPGLDAVGEVVLLAPSWDRSAGRYPEGRFEAIRSGLSERRTLAEQIVVEVASGLTRTEAQLERLFRTSLAARQDCLPSVRGLVSEMLEAGMLRRGPDDSTLEQDGLRSTRLGFIACRHLLRPATVLMFRRVLERAHELTFFDLLLTATASEDCEPVLPVDFEEIDDLAGLAGQEPSVLLDLTRQTLVDLLGTDGKRLLAAVKMALVGRDWTRTGDAEDVARRGGCYPFEVGRLCESLARLLQALGAVAAADAESIQDQEVPLPERVQVLGQMITHGLDEEAATLTLVEGIGGIMARQLKQAGIADIEALAQAEVAELASVKRLAESRARRWIERATEIVRTSSAFRYREGRRPGREANSRKDWPAGVDPYRLRRALDLRVSGQEESYRVTGGLEPHLVRVQGEQLACDCADAAEGHRCKHVLAVRLHRNEPDLLRLAQTLQKDAANAPIDLFALWFSSSTPGTARSTR
jgi:helicase